MTYLCFPQCNKPLGIVTKWKRDREARKLAVPIEAIRIEIMCKIVCVHFVLQAETENVLRWISTVTFTFSYTAIWKEQGWPGVFVEKGDTRECCRLQERRAVRGLMYSLDRQKWTVNWLYFWWQNPWYCLKSTCTNAHILEINP